MTRRAAVAVVGIGTRGFGTFEGESVATMLDVAVQAALDDSGLERRELDGLFVQLGSPRGIDYDEVATLLGLRIEHAAQTWGHGRWAATILGMAAMALELGIVEVALCVAAYKSSLFTRIGTTTAASFFEGMREAGGPHSETPHVGLAAPSGGAAMATQRYLHTFGIDRELLAAVPLAERKAAQLNPLAVMRKPMTREDYLSSRYVVEPLRLFDCSVPTDTACALILARADRARALKARPVYVLGYQGIQAGPNEFIFGQPGLGVNQADVFAYKPRGADEAVYRRAGVGPKDVQTLHLYDAFSPQVLWTLERFGFCAPGEGADFVQAGRIELGGALPVNTSGGLLSEGHSNGWGQFLEIVRQLRGDAGPRQIPGVAVAQWATTLGDSVIFGSER